MNAVEGSAMDAHLALFMFLPLALPDGALIALGGIAAFLLTYLLTFGVLALCRKAGWFDAPRDRQLHDKPVPRLGGIAIWLSFLIASLLFYAPALDLKHPQVQIIFGHSYPKELVIYTLFVLASLLIVIVHAVDDVRGLKPLTKLIAQTIAVIILLGPGLHTFHGVLFFGVHNPFANGVLANPALPWYQQPELTLFIHAPVVSWLAIPAILFTWFWIAGMMNAINFLDGLDGLVPGTVTITGLFITLISWQMGQYSIAILSAIFTGAVAGFLPHNWHPARIIMGDCGAQFLGIALAVLAIMGGAKFALILMLLGIPILDLAWVSYNRLRHGQHPMQRDVLNLNYRRSHLHYRLLYAGFSVRRVCYIIYGLTLIFGLLALSLPSIYKFLGFVLVGLTMLALVWLSTQLQKRRDAEQRPAESH